MNKDLTFHDAKRLYLEQYGDPMAANTYLKIALLLLSLVCIGLLLVDMRTIRTFQNFRPLVIRIDQLGRAVSGRDREIAVVRAERDLVDQGPRWR